MKRSEIVDQTKLNEELVREWDIGLIYTLIENKIKDNSTAKKHTNTSKLHLKYTTNQLRHRPRSYTTEIIDPGSLET